MQRADALGLVARALGGADEQPHGRERGAYLVRHVGQRVAHEPRRIHGASLHADGPGIGLRQLQQRRDQPSHCLLYTSMA